MQEFSSLLALLLMLVTDPRMCVLFLLLLAASVSDFRTYRIPNWLTLGGAIFPLIYAAVAGATWSDLGWSAAGLGVGFMALLPFYAVGVMGAGDVKLMAMAGAFLGLPGIVYAVVMTFIAGGVLALFIVLCRGMLVRTLVNMRSLVQGLALSALGGIRPDVRMDMRKSAGKLPYGISIGLGSMGYVVAHQLGYL